MWNGGGIWVSTDGGTSFSNTFGNFANGIDFSDDLHGVCTSSGTAAYYFTTNGGVTWTTTGFTGSNEAFGVTGIKNGSDFFAVPEVSSGGGVVSPVVRSTNNGASWTTLVSSLPFCSTGDIESSGSLLFLQTSSAYGINHRGVYRSSDHGITWSSIGGPGCSKDSRFVVLQCGNIIYAFDSTGGIWKTTNGGDGQTSLACNTYQDSIPPVSSLLCGNTEQLFLIHNPYGTPLEILSVDLSDTNHAAEASGALALDSIQQLPLHLGTSDYTYFFIHWTPSKIYSSNDSARFRLRIILHLDSLNRNDTLYYPFSAYALYGSTGVSLSSIALALDSTLTCTAHDTIIDILNLYCDTISLDTVNLAIGKAWSLFDASGNSINLPLHIPAGINEKLILRFTPPTIGTYHDTLHMHFIYGTRDTSISTFLLSFGKIQFLSEIAGAGPKHDSVPLCSVFDTTVTFTNDGCDPISLTRAFLSVGYAWQLVDTSGKLLVAPINIAAGHQFVFHIRFTPLGLQRYPDTLHLSLLYEGIDSDIIAPLLGLGIQGRVSEIASLATFDTLSECSSEDSLITFSNLSCDSISVTQFFSMNTAWTILDSAGNRVKFPLGLKSGQTASFILRFSPLSLGKLTGTAKLHFNYLGADSVRTVALTGFSTATGALEATTSINFGALSVCLSSDSLVRLTNTSCDSLLLDSAVLNGTNGFTVSDTLTLPVWIHSGESFLVPVHFHPGSSTEVTDSLQVKYLLDGVIGRKTIGLSGVGILPVYKFVFEPSINSLDFGTHTVCDPPDTLRFTIRNMACDSETLVGCSLSSISGTGVQLLAPNLPVDLSPDSTASIEVVLLSNQIENAVGTLKLELLLPNGQTIDSTLPYSASVGSGINVLQIDSTAINLGTTTLCRSLDTEIVFADSGCGGAIVTDESVSGQGLSILGATILPRFVATGTRDTLHIHYSPTTGTTTGAVSIGTSTSSGRVTISIHAATVAPQHVNFLYQTSAKHGAEGTAIRFTIAPDATLSGIGLTAIAGELVFKQDALEVTNLSTPLANATLTSGTPTVQNGMEHLPVTIKSGQELALTAASPILEMDALAILSKSFGTSFEFNKVTLNGGDSSFANCVLSTSVQDSANFTLDASCGDSLLVDELAGAPLLSSLSIEQNPIHTGGTASLLMDLSSIAALGVSLEICDARGITVFKRDVTVSRGLNHLNINVGNLTTGAYFFRIWPTGLRNSELDGRLLVIE
jgi:hypothetical protein